MNSNTKKIAIFASGSGTNAENLILHFQKNKLAKVQLIICNNSKALVVERAKKFNIPVLIIEKKDFSEPDKIIEYLRQLKIDLIVLAGFLWLMPEKLIQAFPDRIINIHPALLPQHGGKGMYGDKVHLAVINSGDRETGITIHFVNEKFDDGEIIFQAKCLVDSGDDVKKIAEKIHQLEYRFFPKVIEDILKSI